MISAFLMGQNAYQSPVWGKTHMVGALPHINMGVLPPQLTKKQIACHRNAPLLYANKLGPKIILTFISLISPGFAVLRRVIHTKFSKKTKPLKRKNIVENVCLCRTTTALQVPL